MNEIFSLGDISLIPRLAISYRASIFLAGGKMSSKCHRIIFVIISGTWFVQNFEIFLSDFRRRKIALIVGKIQFIQVHYLKILFMLEAEHFFIKRFLKIEVCSKRIPVVPVLYHHIKIHVASMDHSVFHLI